MSRISLILVFVLLAAHHNGWSQRWIKVEKSLDYVEFNKSQVLLTKDTIYFSKQDSFVVLKKGEMYRFRANPYSRSAQFYDSLQVRSYKNRITRELYFLLIKSNPIEIQDTSNFDESKSVFSKYEGLKIRKIEIHKVDVLGGSIHDTSLIANGFIHTTANKLHFNTRNKIISGNLTIKEGDRINSGQLSDNERILRSQSYIEDARIYVSEVPGNPDLADILIVTKDKFSIGLGFDYGGIDRFNIYTNDKNIFGLGHEMRHYLIYNKNSAPQAGYAFRYGINNIWNTFTGIRFDYESSWQQEFLGLRIRKEFLTQSTRYAGGINVYSLADNREWLSGDSIHILPYRSFNQDYWIGRAFNIQGQTTVNASFRFANANFSKRPMVRADTNAFFHNRSIFLAGLSVVRLNYYLSSLVYGFGVTEDIPYGFKFSVLLGIEKSEFESRPYFGTSISVGQHFRFPGYVLFSADFGSFYNKLETSNKVLKIRLFNIGNLHHFNRYSIRNFYDIDFQSGVNMSDPQSMAVINSRWSSIVSGLNRDGLKGQKKLTASAESVLFTPWYLFGFKFAMFGYVDMGWVWNTTSIFNNYSFYSNIGAGLRIKNESWIIETITFGLAWLIKAPAGSDPAGFIFNGSDPRQFNNLRVGRPDFIQMDQSPVLFLE